MSKTINLRKELFKVVFIFGIFILTFDGIKPLINLVINLWK